MNFKAVLALSASLTAFHAMAADCLGEICVGEKVINGYNEVSLVIAIDEGKLITKNSYSSLKTYDLSELSDEMVSSELPEGKTVKDEHGYVGTVKTVFRNGKVLYRRNGNSSDTVGSSLSPEVSEIKRLKAGANIIDQFGYRGVVKQLFQDEQVYYRRNGNSSNSSDRADNLVLRTESLGLLVKESQIIDEYNYRGKVTDLYEDGRTFYIRNGNSSESQAQASKLVLKAKSAGELVVGAKVIDEYNYQGQVSEIYQDGRIFYVRTGNSSETMVSSPRDLVLKVTETGGLTEGASIIDEYNYTGSVTVTYKDGRVFYRRKGNSSDTMTTASGLVKEVSALGDIKPGIFAVDEYNYTGRVSNVFADGRLLFKRDSSSSNSVVSKIFPEVEEHKEYSKEITYASDNLKIGKPTSFFSNGETLHQGSIVGVLYESVERFEDISKETTLVSLSGKTFKAKEIYANGVVVVDDENSSIRKVVSYKTSEHKKDLLQSFFEYLHLQVQTGEKIDDLTRMVFAADEAALIKQDLIAHIGQTNRGWIDSKSKKKILEILVNTVMPGETEIEDPEEYSLSVSPADLIDDVKAALDQEQKKYVFVSPDSARASRKAIIISFSKGVFSARCSVVIKERGAEIKSINKKMDKGDAQNCINELKD